MIWGFLTRKVGQKSPNFYKPKREKMNVPDTTTYFVAGYAVMLVGMAVYLVSLVLRFRNLRQDEQMLEDLDKKDQ
jgi:hypothetical protein